MAVVLPANGPLFQLGVFFLLVSVVFHDLMMLRLVLALGFAWMTQASGRLGCRPSDDVIRQHLDGAVASFAYYSPQSLAADLFFWRCGTC